MRRLFFLPIICALIVFGCGKADKPAGKGEFSRTAFLMGSFVEIKVADEGYTPQNIERTVNSAFDLARDLEKKMNVFDSESELTKLNLEREITASPHFFNVVKRAVEIGRITGGEFDVTVAPILKKKGFYKNMPRALQDAIPDEYLKNGWENITLSENDKKITLKAPIWLDLSGIATGYIVDRMADLLRENGVEGFLIDAGGDICCGAGKNGADWIVGLKKPGKEGVLLALGLANMSVTTSGDYENCVRDGKSGKIYSHIVDPANGASREKELSSVTVIAPACVDADALATAMEAMGPEKAIRLADSIRGVSAIAVIMENGNERIAYSTGAMDRVVWRRK